MDEAQLEVSKEFVLFKTFPYNTQEEEKQAEHFAKEYKSKQEELTGRKCSDIGHTKNCYFVAYCEAGELATEAVKEAGEYYGLNIELTAGYMIGVDWATCH